MSSSESATVVPLLVCAVCGAKGMRDETRCRSCRGLAVGYMPRRQWLYWDYPLTGYFFALVEGRKKLHTFQRVSVFFLWVAAWLGALLVLYFANTEQLLPKADESFLALFHNIPPFATCLFWFGVSCGLYVWYKTIQENDFAGDVEKFDYHSEHAASVSTASWQEVLALPRSTRRNIASAYTSEALQVLRRAHELACRRGSSEFTIADILYTLLDTSSARSIFIRLGVLTKTIQEKMGAHVSANTTPVVDPVPEAALYQVLFQAYEKAYLSHQAKVGVEELLLALMEESPPLQEFIESFDIERTALYNVVEWERIRIRLSTHYHRLAEAARHRPKSGMDRAMTAVATPYLDQFSQDITALAVYGHTEPCVGREKELNEVFRVIETEKPLILLVGDHGIGKRTIVNGLAERMVEDDVPDRLKDKRLVSLSLSSLIAGTNAAGVVERLLVLLNEIARAGNIILFINNIHELMGLSAGEGGASLDVADALAEFMNKGYFITIATTTTEGYAQHLVRSNLGNVAVPIEIGEMDENQSIHVLESRVNFIEYTQQVFFMYDALARAVQLARRFMHEVYLPSSALEIINEAAVLMHTKKGKNAFVSGEAVAEVVASKTKIPVTAVSSDESSKLLRLEQEMHARVIGQDEAVGLVASALRRARAEIRSTSRPIANFLFLGPTGVGKTELTKTIAEVYFGGEERMIRLDMSEYQDKASIYRLIGAPGEKGTGLLTEAVRRSPFSLLLLDEIEKADRDVLNLFLQVMDDGRLTDSTGKVVDFTNIILIATSNAGTAYVSEQLKQGMSIENVKEHLLHGELSQYYRPEFLNRFDGIVLFRPLTEKDILAITRLSVERIVRNVAAKGIELVVEESALEAFARAGFDPEFGARPLRRVLQDRLENKLADLILSGELPRRSRARVRGEGEIVVNG